MGFAGNGAAVVFRYEGELSLGGPRPALFDRDGPIPQWTESGADELRAWGAHFWRGGSARVLPKPPEKRYDELL
jgi:hypothetical protein